MFSQASSESESGGLPSSLFGTCCKHPCYFPPHSRDASWLRLLGWLWDHGVRGPAALPSKCVRYHSYGGDCEKGTILTLTSVVAAFGTISFIKPEQLIFLQD